jgi:hypothetical protein
MEQCEGKAYEKEKMQTNSCKIRSRMTHELEISCECECVNRSKDERRYEMRRSGEIRQNEGKQKRCGKTVFKQAGLRKNRNMREATLAIHLDACENRSTA